MPQVSQVFPSILALLALGLTGAVPFIAYNEFRDRRKAKRIAEIFDLHAAVHAEATRALEVSDGEQHRESLHFLTARIQERLARRALEVEGDGQIAPITSIEELRAAVRAQFKPPPRDVIARRARRILDRLEAGEDPHP